MVLVLGLGAGCLLRDGLFQPAHHTTLAIVSDCLGLVAHLGVPAMSVGSLLCLFRMIGETVRMRTPRWEAAELGRTGQASVDVALLL